jgi:four helix bundle protein
LKINDSQLVINNSLKEENLILTKTYLFGLRILKLYLPLRKKKVEQGLCTQILRSGTSIGANVEEAVGGISKKDFINKFQTAYKEARESKYWLRLLWTVKYRRLNWLSLLSRTVMKFSEFSGPFLNTSKGKK